jgi:hypothetical protein
LKDVERQFGWSDSTIGRLRAWRKYRERAQPTKKERPLKKTTLLLRPDDRAQKDINALIARDDFFHRVMEAADGDTRAKVARLSEKSEAKLAEYLVGNFDGYDFGEMSDEKKKDLLLESVKSWLDDHDQEV